MYNTYTGKEISVIDLPEDGKVVHVSSDEKRGYYFSPNLFTIIDLENYKILKSVEVPFSIGYVALYKPQL